MIPGYPSGLNAIKSVLKRGRSKNNMSEGCNVRKTQNWSLLALKMEGAMSQGTRQPMELEKTREQMLPGAS